MDRKPGSRIVLCVCVPARNEADRLPHLLDALAAQDWPGLIPVSIAINNTTDHSLDVIAAARDRYAGRLDLHVAQADFAPYLAHAGSARRLAMDAGLAVLQGLDETALVSTDADARPPRDWLDNIDMALMNGADLVGGRIDIDPDEALPAPVRRLRDMWDRYWQTVRAIEDAIDPISWDPAPRHGDHTGASLAIRTNVYRACGGVPLLSTGEDRALVAAAIGTGAKLVHPANLFTHVSPRLDGRAIGGMATAMQQLFTFAENEARPMAPAFEHWEVRATWRQRLRVRPAGHALIARREPLLPPMPHDMALETVLETVA
jgi:cellulose synthase/poly-beta-1,6-N-acetylglucosamine synthase-like glycosyltransferase